MRRSSPALIGCLLMAAIGCGSAEGTISGTVSYQGKPLPGGSLTFVPEKGNGVFRGNIEKDGKYRINKIAAGPMKIAVQAAQAPRHPGAQVPPSEMSKGGAKAPAVAPGDYVKIPAAYGDPEKSGLRCTVTGGSQTHDIKLE
jgi:hypothetical protein